MIFYRRLSAIKAMSFDLDDTLYDNDPLMITAEKKLLSFLHKTHPQTQYLDVMGWRAIKIAHLQSHSKLASDMGELRRRTLHTGLHSTGLSGPELDSAVNAAFDYFYFARSDFAVDQNICSLLAKLADKIPLVAITNGNVNLQQIGIAEYFSHTFKASVTMPMKPHSAMFDESVTKLKIPAQSILHVGDNLEKDVMGGINAGFKTAWYACNRNMSLKKEETSVLPHVQLESLNELLEFI